MRHPPRRAARFTSFLAVSLLIGGCAGGPPDPVAGRSTPAPAASTAAAPTQAPTVTSRASATPVGADACLDQPASGVSVRDVHLFQSVRIPLVADGALVADLDRAVDVVADKDAVIGVDLDVADGRAGEVAVRTTVLPALGAPAVRSQRFMPGAVDPDGDPGSVGDVQVVIPRSHLGPDTKLSVTVVECTAGSGTASPDPATRDTLVIDLAARPTGVIKVHLVPFEIAGFVPSTSDAVIKGFREAMLAMYPVTDVEITVGEVVPGGAVPDLGELLVTVGRIRDQDRPARDVYYYGLASGASSRAGYCDGCITGTSEDGGDSGLGFAIGAAFGDARSEETLLHELGHAQGLLHAPCGEVARPDVDFPHDGGVIGVPGYDRRTSVVVPASVFDLMGYCFPRWISDHNYQRLVDRVAAVNEAAASD